MGARVMFRRTVIWGNRLKCWNTMPIFRRQPSISTPGPVRRVPSKRMEPPVGRSSRFRHRRRVDFPEPEGPMITTTSPRRISRETPFRAVTEPLSKRLRRSVT